MEGVHGGAHLASGAFDQADLLKHSDIRVDPPILSIKRPGERIYGRLGMGTGQGDVKRLQGREGYRLCIGWYRVIFDEDARTILAVYIGRRATTTYRRT